MVGMFMDILHCLIHHHGICMVKLTCMDIILCKHLLLIIQDIATIIVNNVIPLTILIIMVLIGMIPW